MCGRDCPSHLPPDCTQATTIQTPLLFVLLNPYPFPAPNPGCQSAPTPALGTLTTPLEGQFLGVGQILGAALVNPQQQLLEPEQLEHR
ncbi:rCG37713 [Rattus norvegicus]|uniref:RCG37713 n=1 Tax=Rattus norvegicus TaxID=10116 RepID=A6JF84_RAT|nr:rCG37713 [Rattus norvegicus]